ncbi:hypothetical protein ACFX11_032468 [Malus domestica]
MLHEARYTKTHELITSMEVNHQLGTPQHGGSFALDMGIPEDRRKAPLYRRSGRIKSRLSRLSTLPKATSRQSHPCKLKDQ